MGQYWMIFNLTAKKFIDPRDWGASRKQGTLGYNEQNITWALIRLLQTKWRGHQIIISGDYADDETEHIEVGCVHRQRPCINIALMSTW
jgi:hypothetical protein